MLRKPLAAMLAPTLLAAWLFAAPARAAGASCEDWNTAEFFKRATMADVSRCLKAGAKVNARDKDGLTPLHMAAAKNATPAVVKVLLANGAKVNARNKDGGTPLHVSAAFSKTPAVVKALLAAGADPARRIMRARRRGITPKRTPRSREQTSIGG